MNQEIDNNLLIKVQNGDKDAQKLFIDSCQRIVFGALKRFDQFSYEEKQDLHSMIICKEIFGENGDWVGIKKYRGEAKFTTYLYGIVTFRALDFLKSKGIKYKRKTVSIDEVYSLFEKSMSEDDKLTLQMCLDRLSERDKKIMRLTSQGYKQREIAEIMQENENNIAAICRRSYQKLKKCMQEK